MLRVTVSYEIEKFVDLQCLDVGGYTIPHILNLGLAC